MPKDIAAYPKLQKLQDMWPNVTAAYQKSGGVGLCDGESTGESTECNLMDWVKYANESLPDSLNKTFRPLKKTFCVKVIENCTKIYRGCSAALSREMMDKSEGCMKKSAGTVEIVTNWCSSDNCNGICKNTANIILVAGLLMGMAIK